MNGRIEKEEKFRSNINKKLENLPPIFLSFYSWMDAREKSYTTINNYINHVIEFRKFFGNCKDDFYKYVTDSDIERYMMFIRRKNNNGEIVEIGDDIRAAKWSSLNTFFKFLIQKKYISNNPMVLTERPKVKTVHEIVYLNQNEINSVFEKIEKESKPMTKNRDACIIALGLSTGLRVSAISNINIEDVDFKTNTIKVIEKGRKTRKINFSNNLRNMLLIWMNDREIYFNGQKTGPLFISQFKKRISIDSIEKLVKKYTKDLSKKITPHKLRSSAAMNLYGAGVDILTIASVLGHENVTTTQRYTKAYDENKVKATKILDDLI